MEKVKKLIQERRNIADKLFKTLDKDNRVNFALTIGSTADGTENELSDIDVCVVMKDDNGLNGILKEVNILFAGLGKMVDYYNYSPYHFYVIYENCIPLDIYFLSSSVYFIIQRKDNKMMIDHSKKNINGEVTSDQKTNIIDELFLRGWARTFRLLSKVRKNDFVTLIFIINQIREDQIIPLLSLVYGYNIPHSKAVKLQELQEDIRHLFVATYAQPTKDSTLQAVQALAKLFKTISDYRALNNAGRLDDFGVKTYSQIMNYKG